MMKDRFQYRYGAGAMRPRASSCRGAAALLAMLFLVLMTTLALAMFSMSSGNVQSAWNFSDVSRAQGAAESGLRWMTYRFVHMARPKTSVGNITPAVAQTLWPDLRTAIITDLNTMLAPAERNFTITDTSITTASISTEVGGPSFVVNIKQDPSDATILIVSSTGTSGKASRSVAMNFKIDKKIKFAVVGRVPVQLGRNTIVEGDIAVSMPDSMIWDPVAKKTIKGSPIQMLSDFYRTDMDPSLATNIQNFQNFLKSNHTGYDGRISVNNAAEYSAAVAQGYADTNQDGYIDEYDVFLKHYDSDGDRKISQSEFTDPLTGKLYEPNLFKVIDDLNGPMFDGDPKRAGYDDLSVDNLDGYAKVRGTVTFAATVDGWSQWLTYANKGTISDWIQGPITPTDPGAVPVKFGADPGTDMIDLNPQNFEDCAANYAAQSGTFAGSTSRTATVIQNAVLSATDANGGTVIEESPKGSKAFQAVYKRPVFQNMTFKNVTIPKGLNAVFKNCKFEEVTAVTTEHDITTSSGGISHDIPSEGMSWARATSSTNFTSVDTSGTFTADSSGKYIKYQIKGMPSAVNITQWDSSGNPILPAGAGSFAYGGSKSSLGSTKGNNLRFDGCEFDGPIAGNYATDYTHFANSWEFTGATMFNNQKDQTATIVSPQVNIEMGSFTDPSKAPSTMIGVVVAGNIDIRGTSNVDGSIIVTGNGAGNTTLGYFGPSDGDSDPSAMPEGGFGRLDIRYNPYRALPDGINIAIEVLPVSGTYSEGITCAN